MKLPQSINADLIPAPQRFNKGSKTQTSKIPSTHESERLKSVFLDAITHDFKTPLTSIKVSVTSLLGDLETDLEQRKELLTIIDEECDRIHRLVSEASEIARLESGEMKLNLASHSIGDIISAALADCRSVTSNRELCLDAKHLDSRLLVDLSLAKRVLVQLVTNAQLYPSPGKPITITIRQRDKFHHISVADQGPGIEEEEIEHIFERFYRGKNVRYRVPGTGMGLPIAKMIVEAHGGTIRVFNCAGRGSVFTFSLPAKRDRHTKHPQRKMRRELKRTPARESKTTVAIHDERERATHPINGWRHTPRIAPMPRNEGFAGSAGVGSPHDSALAEERQIKGDGFGAAARCSLANSERRQGDSILPSQQ